MKRPRRIGSGLAQWLTRSGSSADGAGDGEPDVAGNVFGTGLVKTAEDFGTQGEATKSSGTVGLAGSDLFRERLGHEGDLQENADVGGLPAIVPGDSRNCRQRDPQNRLLARGSRYRLDAEVLRDLALHSSGLLESESRRSRCPALAAGLESGRWWVTPTRTLRPFTPISGSAEHRRTVYTFWKRTAPPPNMSILRRAEP